MLFHGGQPGLHEGDLIFPPLPEGGAPPGEVYLTGDLQLAMVLAARPSVEEHRHAGDVYEVEPLGPLKSVPTSLNDYWLCQLFACSVPGPHIRGWPRGARQADAAAVVRVIARRVQMSAPASDALHDADELLRAIRDAQRTAPGIVKSLLRRLNDGSGDLRDGMASALRLPAQIRNYGFDDPRGWEPCSAAHRHWGVCGGAELRWLPEPAATDLMGERCRAKGGATDAVVRLTRLLDPNPG